MRRQKRRVQLRRAGHLKMKECKIGAALVPREHGPDLYDLYPVPYVPKIGANISIFVATIGLILLICLIAMALAEVAPR
jgi:hypothetical protein